MAGRVFVTVGTTSFDKLVSTIIQSDVLRVLRQKGYTNICLQTGRGKIIPKEVFVEGVIIETFDFKPNIKDEIQRASLVISHAGAGSCLETLEARVPLVVVVNEDLMHNHQIELAQQMGDDGYLYYCTCSTLLETLETKNMKDLKLYPKSDPKVFADFMDSVVGFHSNK